MGAVDPSFNIYYLEMEGNFFYYYIMSCVYGLLTVIVIMLVLATAMLVFGSVGAIQIADSLLKEFLSGKLGKDKPDETNAENNDDFFKPNPSPEESYASNFFGNEEAKTEEKNLLDK